MFSIATIVHWFASILYQHGAHNVLSSNNIAGDGWIATKHYLTIVCHIPKTFHHGTFTCSGYVKR